MRKRLLMSDQTLFRSIDVLEIDYTPEFFNYRESQLKDLVYQIRPALEGGRALNAVCRGLPGTGKTTSVLRIFTELEQTTKKILLVYVNCQNDQTKYMVFPRIYAAVFGHAPARTGISIKSVMDAIGGALQWQQERDQSRAVNAAAHARKLSRCQSRRGRYRQRSYLQSPRRSRYLRPLGLSPGRDRLPAVICQGNPRDPPPLMIKWCQMGENPVNIADRNSYTCIHVITFERKWRGLAVANKNVTLSLDEEIYEKYKEHCKENAIALSRSIELFMEEQIGKKNKKELH